MPRGRQKKTIGPKGEAILAEAARNGSTIDALLADLRAAGVKISRTVAGERLQAARGRQKAKRAASSGKLPLQGERRQPEPITQDEIERAAPATIERALKIAAVALERASANDNLPEIGRLLRNIGALQAEQRKANAANDPEPENDPSLRALGARVAAEFHKMIDQVVEAK